MRIRMLIFPLLAWLLAGPTFLLASDLALVGAKIYSSPGQPPIENGTILVHDGVILAVGPATKVRPSRSEHAVTPIDCKGKIATAGRWNCHVHDMEPAGGGVEHAPSATVVV